METKDLEYGNLKKMMEVYESKGRPESPAFWWWAPFPRSKFEK